MSTVKRCRADLVAGGWLIEWTPARGHRATHYLLVIQGVQCEPPLGSRGVSVNPLGHSEGVQPEPPRTPGGSHGPPGGSNDASRGFTGSPYLSKYLNKDLNTDSLDETEPPPVQFRRRPMNPSLPNQGKKAAGTPVRLPETWQWKPEHLVAMARANLEVDEQQDLRSAFAASAQGQLRPDWEWTAARYIEVWAKAIGELNL